MEVAFWILVGAHVLVLVGIVGHVLALRWTPMEEQGVKAWIEARRARIEAQREEEARTRRNLAALEEHARVLRARILPAFEEVFPKEEGWSIKAHRVYRALDGNDYTRAVTIRGPVFFEGKHIGEAAWLIVREEEGMSNNIKVWRLEAKKSSRSTKLSTCLSTCRYRITAISSDPKIALTFARNRLT